MVSKMKYENLNALGNTGYIQQQHMLNMIFLAMLSCAGQGMCGNMARERQMN